VGTVMSPMGGSGGVPSGSNSSTSNQYLNAIQSLLGQNQQAQNTQLNQLQTKQTELLDAQKGQVKKSQQRQQDAELTNTMTQADSYVELMKKLVSLSARNAAMSQRMFS
jgi:hypothetical protein